MSSATASSALGMTMLPARSETGAANLQNKEEIDNPRGISRWARDGVGRCFGVFGHFGFGWRFGLVLLCLGCEEVGARLKCLARREASDDHSLVLACVCDDFLELFVSCPVGAGVGVGDPSAVVPQGGILTKQGYRFVKFARSVGVERILQQVASWSSRRRSIPAGRSRLQKVETDGQISVMVHAHMRILRLQDDAG